MRGDNGVAWCHPLLVMCCNLETLVAGVRLPWHIPMLLGRLKPLPDPVSKGVMECLLSLDTDRGWGLLVVLLEVEVLVGQEKESCSSDSLR